MGPGVKGMSAERNKCFQCCAYFHRATAHTFPIKNAGPCASWFCSDACFVAYVAENVFVCRICQGNYLNVARTGKGDGKCSDCKNVLPCVTCGMEFRKEGTWKHECWKCRGKVAANKFWCGVRGVYHETIAAKIPDQVGLAQLRQWAEEAEQPGALVTGETRCGKTRSTLLVMRQRILDGNEDGALWLRGPEFANGVVDRCKPGGTGDLSEWLEELRAVGFLFLDEIDKLKPSEKVFSEFFDLLEYRLCDSNPTVLCTNASHHEWQKALLKKAENRDTVKALFGRIYEFCLPVPFFRTPELRATAEGVAP